MPCAAREDTSHVAFQPNAQVRPVVHTIRYTCVVDWLQATSSSFPMDADPWWTANYLHTSSGGSYLHTTNPNTVASHGFRQRRNVHAPHRHPRTPYLPLHLTRPSFPISQRKLSCEQLTAVDHICSHTDASWFARRRRKAFAAAC